MGFFGVHQRLREGILFIFSLVNGERWVKAAGYDGITPVAPASRERRNRRTARGGGQSLLGVDWRYNNETRVRAVSRDTKKKYKREITNCKNQTLRSLAPHMRTVIYSPRTKPIAANAICCTCAIACLFYVAPAVTARKTQTSPHPPGSARAARSVF